MVMKIQIFQTLFLVGAKQTKQCLTQKKRGT